MDPPSKRRSFAAMVDEEDLELTLGPKPRRQRQPDPAPLPRPPRLSRHNGPNSRPRPPPKLEPIVPLYPWATDRPASIYSIDYLLSHGTKTISGTMRCNKCQAQSEVEYNLVENFQTLLNFIKKQYPNFHDRAPQEWMVQNYHECKACGEARCVRPVLPENYAEINWLFLLLGQNIGWCTLDHLKYFCQHTKNHRTGAKDRLLYLTYRSLCRQLDPTSQF